MEPLIYMTMAEFSKELGVSRSRVTQMVQEGLPVLRNGRLELGLALRWLRACLKIQPIDKARYFSSNAIRMAPVWSLLTSCSGFRQSDPEQRNPANSTT
jgi:hypothetical protein